MLPLASGQVHQHGEIVEWSAKLSGNTETPAVSTAATGKATAAFDFNTHTATITIETHNLRNVRTIELRAERSLQDVHGPAILIVYHAKDGSFSGTLRKVVAGPAFEEVAKTVLNGQGVVVVSTAAHPDGEIAGLIRMRKRNR